jgi:hypothetical protein
MRNSISTTKKRLMPLVAAATLLAGGTGAALLFAGGTADAATCAAGATCTLTGSMDLTAGTLNLTAPTALGWGHAITGFDQSLSDDTAADQTYQVVDGTGTASGWDVQIAATQFTSNGTGAPTLPLDGTFVTNGSNDATTVPGTATDATAPTAICATGSTCVPPTNTTTYPVDIVTGPAVAPLTIFNATAPSGVGTITVGSVTAGVGNLVGWWLNVPATAAPGTYSSTVTMQIITAP